MWLLRRRNYSSTSSSIFIRSMVVILVAGIILHGVVGASSDSGGREKRRHRIVLDTDVDTDDFFALLYLLKLNPLEFDVQVITIFFFINICVRICLCR